MTRVYMMESGFLARLRSDRKELLALARSLGTADEMRKARADLMLSTRILLSPKAGTDPTTLYAVDDEGVAHIPVLGELTPAAETDACGAYTAQALTEYGFISAAVKAADADPRVSKIALHINSPGGYADGVDLAAQDIAGVSKPTVAYAGDMATSAAQYIASQADEIIADSPASRVGSIGVATEEYDADRMLEAEGIDHRTYTSSGAPDKWPDTKTEEGRAKIVSYLDDLEAVFVSRVASGRHTTVEDVRQHYGRGATVIATEALKRGMIDGIRGMNIERTAGVAGVATAAKADGISKTGGVKKMDLTELKKDHPALYAEATAEARVAGKVEGITEGVAQERKRLEQLNAFRGINADGDKAVDAAIKDGKAYADVAPLLSAAVAKGSGKGADGDNPPDVATLAQTGGSGMSAEVKAEVDRMAPKMGVTAADIKKYGGEQRGGK
jgi:ClpP class serine protease